MHCLHPPFSSSHPHDPPLKHLKLADILAKPVTGTRFRGAHSCAIFFNGYLVFGLFFLFLIGPSSQLLGRHPHHHLVEEVNADGPYIGLVMAFATEEAALAATGVFRPRKDIPLVEYYGRLFHVGDIFGTKVIYVMTGQRTLNAGVTVQILLDAFDIIGIVHYGIAGSVNSSLSIGDVTIPKSIAYTGAWDWMEFTRGENGSPKLEFGEYDYPTKGQNLLKGVEYEPLEFFSVSHKKEDIFWLELNNTWYETAKKLQDVMLDRCMNETTCLPTAPKVVLGLRASTADIYLDNAAYGEFLFKTFKVATVDEETSAIVSVALSGDVPVVVFRGVSDKAGGSSINIFTSSSYKFAAANAVKVAIEFIRLIGNHQTTSLVDGGDHTTF